MHFSDKIFLLCFLFLLSAPIAVVTEVLEEAGGPVPQNRMQDSIQFFWVSPCLFRSKPPTSAPSHPPKICHILRQLDRTASTAAHSDTEQTEEMLHLDLRTSRQGGRYLSNSNARLAFSDWTSLLSIQLSTGGFQPRSAGFMYRMPGEKNTGKKCIVGSCGLILTCYL